LKNKGKRFNNPNLLRIHFRRDNPYNNLRQNDLIAFE